MNTIEQKKLIFFSDHFFQEYSKEAVAHVQKYLMKNEVPVNLFEVRICIHIIHNIHIQC